MSMDRFSFGASHICCIAYFCSSGIITIRYYYA